MRRPQQLFFSCFLLQLKLSFYVGRFTYYAAVVCLVKWHWTVAGWCLLTLNGCAANCLDCILQNECVPFASEFDAICCVVEQMFVQWFVRYFAVNNVTEVGTVKNYVTMFNYFPFKQC